MSKHVALAVLAATSGIVTGNAGTPQLLLMLCAGARRFSMPALAEASGAARAKGSGIW